MTIKEIVPTKDGLGKWYLCQHMKGTKTGEYYILQSCSCLVYIDDKYNGAFNHGRDRAVRKLRDTELKSFNLVNNL